MSKLPNKLSGLMKIALDDLAKAEKSKNIGIDMDDWVYNPSATNPNLSIVENMERGHNCSVCFAGAVMAYSLNVECFSDMSWSDYNKMIALNSIRRGRVATALSNVAGTPAKADDNVKKWLNEYPNQYMLLVTPYDLDPKEWRKDMNKIISKLKELGL